MRSLAFALAALWLGCAKKTDDAPKAVVQMPADEVKRGQDACNAYVEKVCACTAPAAAQECKLARALPDALQLSLSIAAGTQKADEARSAIQEVRKVTKGCIESLAQLPALGCP